ncbi:MAG: hypothetical protein O8C64_14160 [Candidatus Methanoperedens sp.]|nr:hypothetical protein [Candidatus Methanoperedens sp.]MCZ7404399.1 hypothetical protein [Candidatus Methanoperedens sp.]
MTFLERTKSVLGLAVMLKDDLSPDKKTIGDVFLKATRVKKKIIQHGTGYFLLIDLPEGEHVLTGGGHFYKSGNLTIDTKSIDPKQPFAELALTPKSNYPFPGGITVLLGRIIEKDYRPIANADINVTAMAQSATSEDDGGFFIMFTIDSDINVTLTINKVGYINGSVPVLLKKGVVTRIIEPIMLTRQ